MSKKLYYTSINANYLPNARILAKSIKNVDPSALVVLLFIDLTPDFICWEDEPFDDVLFFHELPISNHRAVAFQYNVVELCTAVKGVAAKYLFDRTDAEVIIYLDPDCVLFSPLNEALALIEAGNTVVLTPHLTNFEDTEAHIHNHEIAALKHGTFNLGFLVLKRPSETGFLDWWADRCLRFSKIDFNTGLFTDQKWCNIAPYIFEGIGVLTTANYNLATWNSSKRLLSKGASGEWFVNGLQLRFYHFSGFGSDFTWAKHELGLMSTARSLEKEIWADYEMDLKAHRLVKSVNWYWGLFENGVAIAAEHRKTYAESSLLKKEYPNPFSRECHRAMIQLLSGS